MHSTDERDAESRRAAVRKYKELQTRVSVRLVVDVRVPGADAESTVSDRKIHYTGSDLPPTSHEVRAVIGEVVDRVAAKVAPYGEDDLITDPDDEPRSREALAVELLDDIVRAYRAGLDENSRRTKLFRERGWRRPLTLEEQIADDEVANGQADSRRLLSQAIRRAALATQEDVR